MSTHTPLPASSPAPNDPYAAEGEAADISAVAVDIQTWQEAGKDLNGLAGLTMPHIMVFLFPPMFIYFWERSKELLSPDCPKKFPKLALGIPRGHGKTMFLKLLVVFIILFTKKKFILVICAKANLAEAIVSDVIDLLSHDNVRTLFGNWDEDVSKDRQDTKIFTFRGRTVILKGVGQGTSFRGIAEKLSRPDVMIFDDSQTKECAMSEAQAKEYASWFRGTAMKAKAPNGCFFLYVGNMYPKLEVSPEAGRRKAVYGCMLKNLKQARAWESIIVGAILADGKALWEELQPLEQLLEEFEEDSDAGQEDVFLAEVMNDDEAINTNMFDESKVPPFPFIDSTIPQGSALIIDPSLGQSTSDDQMVGWLKVIDGERVLWELRNMQVSAPQLVRQVIDWCLQDNIKAIICEGYGYQKSLAQWFVQVLEEMNIVDIQVLVITRGKASKNSAILSMLKELMDGDLYLHPQVVPMIYSEIRTFDPLKKDNKDNGLDVATYCNPAANMFSVEIAVNTWLATGIDYQLASEVIDVGMNYK